MLSLRFIPQSVFYTRSVVRSPCFILTGTVNPTITDPNFACSVGMLDDVLLLHLFFTINCQMVHSRSLPHRISYTYMCPLIDDKN